MTEGLESDEPIDDQVPVADAVEQRQPVRETRNLSEEFEPTEVSELAAADTPVEADPADWLDQKITAEIDPDDRELDI